MDKEIKKFFKGDIKFDSVTLKEYSHDASLFSVKPKLVLFPKDSSDVSNLVKWVRDNKAKYPDLSITARSAGTDMTGGPINDSLILDFTKYMNQLLKFDSSSKRISVQPGMLYRDFEKITLEKDLILPSYPASKSIAAVGGMVANNAGGEKTLKYGKTEKYVDSLKMVLHDGKEYEFNALQKIELENKIKQNGVEGELYKQIYTLLTTNYSLIQKAKPDVSKNSAGYYAWNVEHDGLFDLPKLIVGSQGTLGIITEITFKLVSVKKENALTVIYMRDLNHLADLVNDVRKLEPESLEVYDDATLKLAIKFFPNFLKGKGIIGSLKFAFSFIPDLLMMFLSGMPKLVILAEFAGNRDEVNKKCVEASNIADKFKFSNRITSSKQDTEKYFEIRRESFNLLRKHVKGKKTAPFIDDIIVKPEYMPKFLPELRNILKDYPIEYTLAGHAGDGNFHIIPLMKLKDRNNKKNIMELSDKVYDLVLKYHGSITAEHNDGIIRTPYLEKMYGTPMVEIFKQIKTVFDPQQIFNPGKKTAGTKEDIEKHLAI